jgi:plastocyanin
MRSRGVVVAIVAVLVVTMLSACSGGGRVRTVLIDFDHDEFTSTFWSYFPRNVVVHPGDTVVFRQAWTGEPHTVTLGTLFDDAIAQVPALRIWSKVGGPMPDIAPEEMARVEEALAQLPGSLNREEIAQQNGAQPCFLEQGRPPADPDRPCADDAQRQPAFNGRHSYYNSGLIPFEGSRDNEYTVPLSDDVEPGDYAYYCNVHGIDQSGVITVVPEEEQIPSQAQVDREARREVEQQARPLVRAYGQARRGQTTELLGRDVDEALAGWLARGVPGVINEFVPRRIQATVGQKVTWRFVGLHTVSFDVPTYAPVFTIDDDTGTVTINREVVDPVGGPGFPLTAAIPTADEPDAEVDAGTYDGEGFLSSGVIRGLGKIVYSVTFSEPGTYNYACLIHPRMIGQVVVS